MKVNKPKIIKEVNSFLCKEITSIFTPCVLFNIVFILVAMFFLRIFLIGKIAAIIGAKKFRTKARKKESKVIPILRSVFNSSFITPFIILSIKKLKPKATTKAGKEKQMH